MERSFYHVDIVYILNRKGGCYRCYDWSLCTGKEGAIASMIGLFVQERRVLPLLWLVSLNRKGGCYRCYDWSLCTGKEGATAAMIGLGTTNFLKALKSPSATKPTARYLFDGELKLLHLDYSTLICKSFEIWAILPLLNRYSYF